MKCGFEQASDFDVSMTAPIWNNSANEWHVSIPSNTIEQTTEQIHSGNQACKLSLLNPIDHHSRIINIERNLDPLNDNEVQFECWYYLPTDFTFEEWINIHRSYSERLWRGSRYEWFQFSECLNTFAQYNPTDLQISVSTQHGWVDNDFDGANDLIGGEFLKTPDFVRRGEWFGIRTYILRNPIDGIYKLWLNTPRSNDWVLQWEKTGIRTEGIDRNRIAEIGDTGLSDTGWTACGIALYCGPYPAVPKYCYYDDVIFGSEDMSAQTDNNGNFSMNLAPGTYTITVTKSGFNDGSATATIQPGQTTTQNFTLSFQDGILSGQVVDENGIAIPQATVTAVEV